MAVFTAILRSYQLLADEVERVMRSHDLTFARYEVLTWLMTDPESSLTLSWISKTLRIPPATVTNIIDRLEADQLVRRVPHPSDARTTLAEITASGRTLAATATPIPAKSSATVRATAAALNVSIPPWSSADVASASTCGAVRNMRSAARTIVSHRPRR